MSMLSAYMAGGDGVGGGGGLEVLKCFLRGGGGQNFFYLLCVCVGGGVRFSISPSGRK